MIISCTNCNKKFNIDEKLIPENGRLLQCSSCNHKWHYTIPKKDNEIKKTSNINEEKNFITTSLKHKKNINKNQNLNIKNKNKNNNLSLENILNNLIIIFITFTALILILDTFKINVSNYLPILTPLLDNLYQSFFDLSSFVKDLFN